MRFESFWLVDAWLALGVRLWRLLFRSCVACFFLVENVRPLWTNRASKQWIIGGSLLSGRYQSETSIRYTLGNEEEKV